MSNLQKLIENGGWITAQTRDGRQVTLQCPEAEKLAKIAGVFLDIYRGWTTFSVHHPDNETARDVCDDFQKALQQAEKIAQGE